MHVERYGHGGAPVVLLHGFGTCSFLWRNVGPTLALTQHTAYGVDLLGYGESDRPFDADFGLAAQADYLERALTALRVARAAIVGVDLGAAIALRLAAVRPERVARLVLINPIGGEDIPGGDIRAMQRNTARFALRVSRGLFGASALLSPILTQSVADPARMPPMLIGRYVAPFIGQEGVTHLLALARAVRPTDLEDLDLAQVRAHTLIVRSEKDAWVDGAVSRKLAAEITDCRVVSFAETARLVPEEAPDELASLIASFISPHVGPPRTTTGPDELAEGTAETVAEDAGTQKGGLA
jgi:pimeloyl-ACP methyl ester carboxylesterase